MIYDFNKSLHNYFQSGKPSSFLLQSRAICCTTCNMNLRSIPQAQVTTQAQDQNPSPLRPGSKTQYY